MDLYIKNKEYRQDIPFTPRAEFDSVPNIHEYKNDPGYYIYANPSDAGNVTYGIHEAAYPIFDELGYRDEDPISWQIIQALKQAGLDDTDGEGAIPESDPATIKAEKSPDLTDRERFYELLKEAKQLSAEEKQLVRETLGLAKDFIGESENESVSQHGPPEESTEEVTGHWLSRTEKRLDEKLREAFPQMTTEHLLNGGDDRRAISVTEMGDDREEDYVITLEEPRVDDGRVVEYQVTVTAESVIIDMVDRFEVSEEVRVEAFSHAAIIDEVFSKYDPSFEAATPTVEIRF